jgi:acylglycerol lipase
MINEHGELTTTFSRHEWTAPDGETFPYSAWGANLKTGLLARAVVIAVHGLSGAAVDFEPLGRHLARHGIVTFALELRGQGNDPVVARRGDLERPEQWFSDLSAFFTQIHASHAGIPVFYYGESLGGALLTRFLAQAQPSDQPAGVILASPVVEVPGNPGWWRQFVFHFFLFISPRRRIEVSKYTKREDENNPSKWVTRDEAHRRWFETSSHRITSFTFRFFKCVFDIIGGAFAAAPRVSVPALVIYAANDVFIPPARVEAFCAQIGSADKETALFQDSYHLLLHDYDKAHVLEKIETWLLARLSHADTIA